MDDLPCEKLAFAIKEAKKNIGRLRKQEFYNKAGEMAVNTFKITSIIGRGSFGIVSIIEKNGRGLEALKTVYQDIKYCNRELEILLEIEHKNIITLNSYYYSKITRNGCYLNMCFDFIPLTLADLILKKDTEISTIKKLYFQAIDGLNYLHNYRICHRDIKPTNLLVDFDMNLKICDFGSAKQLAHNSENISYICSRFYRSPENLMNYRKYDTKIDIWALAATFCEFRLDQPLFKGQDTEEMLDMIFTKIKHEDHVLERFGYTKTRNYDNFDFKGYLFNLFKDEKLSKAIYNSLIVDPERRISAKSIIMLLGM